MNAISTSGPRARTRGLVMFSLVVFSGFATGASADTHATSNADTPASVAPVNLGSAGAFVILSKSGITDVPASAITGNVGTSPITGAADHLTCAEVTGKVYSVDAAGPAPCSIKSPAKLTAAIGDMQRAYTDAAGRSPTTTELGAGNIGGLTLAPGVYSWSTSVTIPDSVTLKGGASQAVWIFQIMRRTSSWPSGNAVASCANGMRARNVIWQVAGKTTLGTTSHFRRDYSAVQDPDRREDGRIDQRQAALAQTAVTLQMNSVTAPSGAQGAKAYLRHTGGPCCVHADCLVIRPAPLAQRSLR